MGRNNFASHYNKKLDKCFIRIDYSYFPKEGNERSFSCSDIWDAFEGTNLGRLCSPVAGYMDCMVGKKTCNSVEEFENLVRPYMEE